MNPKRNRAECAAYHPDPEFVPFPAEEIEQTIPDRFWKQVEKFPDRLAVKTEDLGLTYGELNRAANRAAHAILGCAGGGQHRVGVLLAQGSDIIVAILAVLKSGNVYVPLDPAAPAERLRAIVKDSGSFLVITNTENTALAERLSGAINGLLNLDELDPTLPHGDPDIWSSPDSLATILYTSGSTGEPKGVMHGHWIWLADLRNRTQVANLSPNDRMVLLGYPGFAASFMDIFYALLNGGLIVLYDVRERGVSGLALLLVDECITVYHSVATVYRQFITSLRGQEEFPALRLVHLSGEPVASQDLEEFKKHFGVDCLVLIMMGATETTYIFACFVDRTTPPESIAHLIGYPLESQCVALFAEDGHTLDSGVVGEIGVASHYLSYGYWQRSALTAEAFQPSAKGVGLRVYHTGDLGKKSPDGLFEHMGRKDFQVKIRGQRVELGEIEGVLLQQSGVNEAVVVAREQQSGNPLLTAYVGCGDREAASIPLLRAKLGEKLPHYMVPQVFIPLQSLPMTASGKVDLKALPDPEDARLELQAEYAAPRTPVEEQVASIWETVLGVERVAIHDNFFELGGHSLLATQVISRLRSAFHLEMPVRTLFEAPTIASLAERLGGAGSEELTLEATPLIRVPRDNQLPLSFAQQRLWFLHQLEPGSAAYNMPGVFRLRGALNVSTLARSLREIVRRHESLRTTFAAVDGQPEQVVAPDQSNPSTPFGTSFLRLAVADLSGLSASEQESEVRELVRSESRWPFDLSTGPLLRIVLLKLGDEEFVWLSITHHIVTDGWSQRIFFQELAALYKAFGAGQSSPLPEVPIQYADFAVWQRRWLQGEGLERQLTWWKKELDGVPTLLELSTDRPRPAIQTFDGELQTVVFPRELHERLKRLSQAHGVTLFMTLLAAFQVLLYRYTGQEDFVVGSPIANRNRSELEGLIGFFVNMMCLRADLSGNPSFRELSARVRVKTLGAYEHQDMPFERLVDEIGAQRDLSRTPVFQVVFVLQNAPVPAMELAGLSLSPLESDRASVRYDLELHLWEGLYGLSGTIIYNTDLFASSSIGRMVAHYRTLLEGIVADPEQRVSVLPILSEAERHQLLVEWNDTEAQYPRDWCIHELFEAQVERKPESVAVVFQGDGVTYGELNSRANQLAHYLIGSGVGPEVLVGVLMERSVEMVVALLGILKAGGAYVPLDPTYPKERLGFMIQDSRISVILTQGALRNTFSSQDLQRSPYVLWLDEQWPAIAKHSSVNVPRSSSTENLTYVIYTSGSTGTPKGIAMRSLSLQNLLGWQLACMPHGTRTLQFTSLNFDVSFQEMFSTWLTGGSLVLISEERRADLRELLVALEEEQIERLFLPFVALHHLAEAAEGGGPASLCEVITAGEPLQITRPIAQWFEQGGYRLYNQYGPSETHVVTSFELNGPVGDWPALPPIGRPISNTQTYLVDAELQAVSIGVTGELLIGGDGLARGYWNGPDVSADRYVPSPFSTAPGQRLYRTGDLARYVTDGNIEFLGRGDHQVKIRGFRVEPGEIEAVLSQHPAVREAVVVASEEDRTQGAERREQSGAKQLVGYYVAAAHDETPNGTELRAFLREKLPDYMIPSAFILLESLPLTPNGKVDRKALPGSEWPRTELENTYVAPRTATEALIVEIWSDVLGLEHIGVHDKFFELGGHSLLAIQILSRLCNAVGIELPVRALFEGPTVADLAERIELLGCAAKAVEPFASTPSSDWEEIEL